MTTQRITLPIYNLGCGGEGYSVKDGAIICAKGGGGNLFTEKEYADFVLRFEFKLEPGANNGLGIRAPLEGDAAYVGMELYGLDGVAWAMIGVSAFALGVGGWKWAHRPSKYWPA